MGESNEIVIDGRSYRRNPSVDRFQIPLNELGNLRMIDIPGRSHLEVLGLPVPVGPAKTECYAVHAGHAGVDGEDFSIYGGVWYTVERMIAREQSLDAVVHFPTKNGGPPGLHTAVRR